MSARCTFYTFLKAQVTVEMEILKVTNPITHEENVLTVSKLKMGKQANCRRRKHPSDPRLAILLTINKALHF